MAVENKGGRQVEKWVPEGKREGVGGDNQWWRYEGAQLASSVTLALEGLRAAQSMRLRQLALSTMLYGGRPAFQVFGKNQLRLARSSAVPLGRLTYNVIQSAVDTLVSKVSQDESVPYFLTSGGTWKQQRQAKKLTKFVDGVLYENSAQILNAEVLRDALIMGDGIVYGYKKQTEDGTRVCFERVLATEMYVDELEGMYGKPRTMHRIKNVDRKQLMSNEAFKGKRPMIESAQPVPAEGAPVGQTNDVIEVRESWHLPSAPGKGDGVHAISIAEGTLFQEKYSRDWFPFERWTWCDPIAGYWGIGAAAQIQGIQLELNKLLWLQSRAIHLAGAFRVWLKIGSKVVKEHFNNEVGTVGYYAGDVPPQDHVVQPVHAQIIERIQQLKQDAFEQLGVSMLSAQSKKPAGLSSGEALREYASIESERFYAIGRKNQDFMKRLAELAIKLVKEVAEEEGHYKVKRPSRSGGKVDEIDWADLDLDDDCYVTKCFAVSNIPQSPAGLMSTIAERVQAGWLNPRQARRLMNFPDLAAADNLQDAAEDYLYGILDKMVDGDDDTEDLASNEDYTPPSPEDDLQAALEIANEYLMEGKANGCDEFRLSMVRLFITQVNDLMAAAAPPPAPAGPGAPGMPGAAGPDAGGAPTAVPNAPPTSDLMPIKPQ